MYCYSCGQQLPDSASFCPNCGAKTAIPESTSSTYNPPGNSSLSQQMSLRQENIGELDRIYSYFLPKAPLYDEYDQLHKEMKYCNKGNTGLLIVGIGVIILGFFLASSELGRSYLTVQGLLVGIGIAIIGLLAGIIMIISYFVSEKKRKVKIQTKVARIDELTMELTENYKLFGPCIVGAEYSNPRILNALRNLITNGRADTVKEALNVMLDDSHKTQMQLQAELQTKSLNSIRQSSAISAGANVATAGFCAADFFVGLI